LNKLYYIFQLGVSLNQSTSVVRYGTDPNNLIYEAVGSISTYTSAGWVGTIHRATMTDLKEKVTYYYKVGDGNKLWSDVFSFTPTPQENPITYVVIADMDFDKYSDNTVKAMKNIVDNKLAQVIFILFLKFFLITIFYFVRLLSIPVIFLMLMDMSLIGTTL
jgi:hypothetical protein